MSDMPKGFKQTEIGLIPEDWNAAPITEVILESNGIKIGPFGSQLKKELLTEDGYKVYGQENVYENTMEIGTRYISREHFLKLSSCEIKSGDFLISMMGTIGKCMIVPDCFEQGIMDSHLIRLRLNSNKLNSELLLHFFASNHLQAQVKKYSVGGIMDGLSSKIVKQLQIPLPPNKTEQTAIAAALNDADALITALEKLIAKKKAVKLGAMQELLKPKAGWEVKKLGDLTKVFTKQTGFDYTAYIKPSLVKTKNDDTIPFIQNKDFNNRWINFKTDYYIPKTVAFNFPRILLNEKSLLISISGSVGNVGVYDSKELAFIGGAVAILKFKNPSLIDWVWTYLISERGQEKLFGCTKSSSHVNLILDDIRRLEIEFPTEKEQACFAQIFTDIDSEIAALEQKLEKQKQIKQGMMQVLLTGKVRLV